MKSVHYTDAGYPMGGITCGTGFTIGWQHGPLGRDSNREPNGATIEAVIEAVIDRLESYQRSKVSNISNELAIKHLREALTDLNYRTADRESRGVEGSNEA